MLVATQNPWQNSKPRPCSFLSTYRDVEVTVLTPLSLSKCSFSDEEAIPLLPPSLSSVYVHHPSWSNNRNERKTDFKWSDFEQALVTRSDTYQQMRLPLSRGTIGSCSPFPGLSEHSDRFKPLIRHGQTDRHPYRDSYLSEVPRATWMGHWVITWIVHPL